MARVRNVNTSGMPIGTAVPGGRTTPPPGTLLCDGSAVSRTTYAALFAVIGIAHGQGDGSTTFNLPDYRGRFIRGVDGSAGIDPDKASRSAMNTGGNTGNNVGSVQGHAIQGHMHGTALIDPAVLTSKGDSGADNTGVAADYGSTPGLYAAPNSRKQNRYRDDGVHGSPQLSTESRPANAYANWFIAYI